MLKTAAVRGKTHYHDQFWISGEMIVRDVDREVIETIRSHPDVESLIAEEFIQLEETAGVLALVRSARPGLTVVQAESAVTEGAVAHIKW